VVATWPTQEPLGDDDEPLTEAFREQAKPSIVSVAPDELAVGSPPAAAPDLALGTLAGEPDEPEHLLHMLRERGIFEPPDTHSPSWTPPEQVARSGTRLRDTVLAVWVSALVLCAGGYVGWQQWVARRHAEAARLVAEAKADAYESDYARLVDAERLLRLARDQHPRSVEIPRLELFVHCERVLESGSRELSALRLALLRAQKIHVDAGYVAAGRAVLAAYSGIGGDAEALLKQAADAARGEGALLYVVGRLQQRLGQADAGARLQAAVAAAPDLLAASLALAELQQERGHEQEALAGFDAVLGRHPDQLRAKLWRAFLSADAQDPAQGMSALDALSKHAHEGAPIDRILWALARARLLERKGQLAPASEAVRDALSAGASEPRLLAMVAAEARRAGQLGLAQQAASQAVSIAPNVPAYRGLLASILIERHDGDRALSFLAQLPTTEPALLVMRARAALQTGDPQAMRGALEAIEPQPGGGRADVGLAGLRLRLRAALEPSAKLLQDAKTLLHRAPGDPDALRAVGEAALALGEPRDATSALEQLVAVAPDDAEAHHLLGRARRMATDAKGAEASLRRALELAPGFPAVLATLGSLLLDTGRYAEADAIYQQLSSQDALQGRLGRAEALLGQGRVDDAQAQVAGVAEAARDSAAARQTGAKVALARHQPGEAITLLRPLVDGEGRRAPALALYGDALYAAQQVNPAAGAYDGALELDAALPEALLGRAVVHLRAERSQDAIALLEKAKTALETRLRAPELRARMLTLLGHAYVQRGRRSDLEVARDLLRQAVTLAGPPPEAFFWLGEALGGRITPESAAAFKRYLELEPEGDYVARARRALGPLL
jgi:tetratricopeptide (TPR) repeat protein